MDEKLKMKHYNNIAFDLGGKLWCVCRCPTPTQAQETLANEAGPHLANHSQVGLPSLCQYPAERGQKEEVQKGSSHSAQSLETKEGRKK